MNKVILLLLLCFINNCFAENSYFIVQSYPFNSVDVDLYANNIPSEPSLGTPPYPTDPNPRGDVPRIVVTPPPEEVLASLLL